jgi:hypothetical protein
MKKMRPLDLLLCLLAVFVLLLQFTACITLTAGQPMCDDIPDGQYSVICLVAGKMNTTPEAAGAILRLANLSALATDRYTAIEADRFVREVDAFLVKSRTGDLTYAAAMTAAVAKYQTLSPAARAVFILFEDLAVIRSPGIVDLPLSEIDYAALFTHLDRQRALIAPFLAAQ